MTENKRKKILIPYASYGSGHKTVAKGIADHFNKNEEYEVLCIDILKYLNPYFEKLTVTLYEKLCFRIPFFMELMYQSTDFDNSASFHKLYNNKKFRKIVFDFNPDIVISTHFFTSRLIADYVQNELITAKLITIVTDYKTHAQWLTKKRVEDAIVINTKAERQELIKKGIPTKRIYTFGIPVSEKFYEIKNSKSLLIKKFNLDIEKPTILFIAGGSAGLTSSLKYLKALLDMKKDVNILFISGTNKKVYKKAGEYEKQYKNLKVFGFVTNMPEFFVVADLVITKPGGATVTECLHMNKPMLFISFSAGQEKENYRYVVKSGFGKKTSSTFFFKRTLNLLIENPKHLQKMSKKISESHNINAIKELENLVNKLINN